MVKLEKVFDEWLDVNKKLYNTSKDILIDTLSKVGGNRVEIDNEEAGYVTVPYDGGRHPEYASDCFCEVYGVYLKDGEVYLSTREDDEYHIDRINAESLYDVTKAVLNSIN